MLKRYGRLIAVLVIALIVGVIALVVNLRSEHGKTYSVRQACNILTPKIAGSVGGPGLQKSQPKTITTKDNVTTFCVYRGTNTSLSLIVRSAKNEHGTSLNHEAFSSPPIAYQKVSGYGDDAYWTPKLGQFDILKNDTWYIMSNGPNTPSSRTLKDAKTLANTLASRL